MPLLMIDSTFEEFGKQFYAKNIREAAQNKSLTLDDILMAFQENVGITVYACGYDSVTGARKMFISKKYTINDVKPGKFNSVSNFKKYNEYVKHILTIPPLHINQNTEENSGQFPLSLADTEIHKQKEQAPLKHDVDKNGANDS